jgi:hypothetical protein
VLSGLSYTGSLVSGKDQRQTLGNIYFIFHLKLRINIFVAPIFTTKSRHATKTPSTGLNIEKPAIPVENRHLVTLTLKLILRKHVAKMWIGFVRKL